jgi:hypothetical protein
MQRAFCARSGLFRALKAADVNGNFRCVKAAKMEMFAGGEAKYFWLDRPVGWKTGKTKAVV